MQHSILCVDDEIHNVEALDRLFRKKYRVLKATSGKEALKILKDEKVSLIISDQRMPNMTGVEFLEKSIEVQPEIIKILLTGYTDIESVVAAINSGQIYRYVTKPWDPRELSSAVDRGIERFELTEALKQKNAELEKALEELKTLDAAKDHFMILINHELKTPLTVLLSFLELLGETKLDEDQSKYLNRIVASSTRLKDIVFDVLDLVSAETGRTKANMSKVSLESVADEAQQYLKSISPDQDLLIENMSGKVVGDGKLVINILKRLLHNASKFGSPGKEIKLMATEVEEQTQIEVINSGKPISSEASERLKKPFSLDENIMNHSKGLGLGLTLSQALLKLQESELLISPSKTGTSIGFRLKSY